MKKAILSLLALMLGWSAAPAADPAADPVQLIFDTDIGNDCDDAMALAVIHALENRNVCRLLAVTLTNPDPLAGRFIDAINTFYGRPDIPIGVNPNALWATKVSKFLSVAEHYPHDFDPAKAPSALNLLRRTLAAADDQSVVIVQVGFFTNLAQLLDSPADEVSPLSGRELIQRKVKRLSLMAGAFAPGRVSGYVLEFNVKMDIPSAITVAKEWPTPAVWSGAEIGEAVLFPAKVIDRDFSYVPRHPVKEAYQLYRPTPHERPCFDLTSVLQAVWPDRDYFALSVPGNVEVQADSFTKFVPAKEGLDRYLIVDRDRSARIREVFAALVSEPPMTKTH